MIYVLGILDRKFVKIGFTAEPSPHRRIAELQCGSPFELKYLLGCAGTLLQEQSIHSALTFAFARIRVPMPPNEWYPGKLPFMGEFLDALRLGVGPALAYADSYNDNVRRPRPGTSYDPHLRWATPADDRSDQFRARQRAAWKRR